MSGLFLDAYSGISGDMLLGALLDLGVPLDRLRAELGALGVGGWTLEREAAVQHGVSGTRAKVLLDDAPQPHRHLSDITALLDASSLEPEVRANALGVFRLLAEAEAKVHGASVEDVHFHEVGAVDALVDIVGACIGLRLLGVRGFTCSPLPLGTGFVRAAHGVLPVPAPAALEILTRCGAPVLPDKGEGEMVTPTGAALVAFFGGFDAQAPVVPERVGYGFGTRELPWPNALRAVLTRTPTSREFETDEVVLLECNIDDMNAELYPFVVERLLEAGALDAWTMPIGMKKGRPGVLLSALAPKGDEARLAWELLSETTTLGVRHAPYGRLKAGRREEWVETAFGAVRVKLKLLYGEVVDAAPEYEDCARVARESGMPLRVIYDEARHAADQLPDRHE